MHFRSLTIKNGSFYENFNSTIIKFVTYKNFTLYLSRKLKRDPNPFFISNTSK